LFEYLSHLTDVELFGNQSQAIERISDLLLVGKALLGFW